MRRYPSKLKEEAVGWVEALSADTHRSVAGCLMVPNRWVSFALNHPTASLKP